MDEDDATNDPTGLESRVGYLLPDLATNEQVHARALLRQYADVRDRLGDRWDRIGATIGKPDLRRNFEAWLQNQEAGIA